MLFNPLLIWALAAVARVVECTTEDDDAFRQDCLSLNPAALIRNSTLVRLEFVAQGTTVSLNDNVPSCNRPAQKVEVDLCRVGLQIPTSKRSSISFELWLPREWKGSRYLATGNGGVDGCIKYEDLAYGVANRFATMGTNNGHNSTTAVTMLNNPDIVEDFSYRALHTGTESAKKIIKAFYDKKPDHSYFIGCSLGGRMGIKAAELFPEDYDGIVAGAPTVDFNKLQGARAFFYTVTGAVGPQDFISADTWTGLIHDEVLWQCDEIDGVADGIIEVPNKCHFDPQALLCKAPEAQGCLNEAQVQQLEKIYAPYEFPDGEPISPRLNPGAEKRAVDRLLSGLPFTNSVEWFRYVVLSDPAWQPEDYTSNLIRTAEAMNPSNIRTYPRTLPGFRARGGKLITYHGGQDQQLTQFNTERFVERMARGDGRLSDYHRYFPISGMFHCNTGPGAWVLGQGGNAAAAGIGFDAESNVLAAAVAWVEEDRAPEMLRGTKFVDDAPAKGVDFQRDHCAWPRQQTFMGGDYKKPESWRCVK
ncbi:feruloyl esterase B-2 like protein [Verticillium longisporum]|uniref:Carboxylic ester hydrolase n=1 Tax=Verticillium longisporum TaxID=100787 RepID=A0A8I2ZH62_VERLO|nr:feruloyl esterase B-2 like protein [Verticillium longisporum]